jgi:hypothetical protein
MVPERKNKKRRGTTRYSAPAQPQVCHLRRWARTAPISKIAAVERELLREKHVMRYANSDDCGMPEAAFPDLPVLADRCLVGDWAA